jgi:hypothetical protein
MLDGTPVGQIGREPLTEIFNSPAMQELRRLHSEGRAGEIDMCARCCTTIPHPALVAGSLVLHGRTVRRMLPVIERLTYLSKLPARLLRPQTSQPAAAKEELVQIQAAGRPPQA